jgi:hypothetical protein
MRYDLLQRSSLRLCDNSMVTGAIYTDITLKWLKTETDPVSETLLSIYLEFQTMKNVHKPNESEDADVAISSFSKAVHRTEGQTNKPRGLSPRANYTDRATAACRWS